MKCYTFRTHLMNLASVHSGCRWISHKTHFTAAVVAMFVVCSWFLTYDDRQQAVASLWKVTCMLLVIYATCLVR